MKRTELTNLGCHAILTNAYCLQGLTEGESSSLENHLKNFHIPVIGASVGGISILGSLIAGNSQGCVVSSLASDQELHHIRHSLPASVNVVRLQEQLSTTPGNLILCNDLVAVISEKFDQVTRDIIADALDTEVFMNALANEGNLNSYCLLNNEYCGVGIPLSQHELQNFADIVQVPASVFTVGKGCKELGREIILNDIIGLCGPHSTSLEVKRIEAKFFGGRLGMDVCDVFDALDV